MILTTPLEVPAPEATFVERVETRFEPCVVALDRVLAWKEVGPRVGISRRTVDKLERDGTFPRRRQLSPGRVGWIESEVAAWIAGERDWTLDAQASSAARISPA